MAKKQLREESHPPEEGANKKSKEKDGKISWGTNCEPNNLLLQLVMEIEKPKNCKVLIGVRKGEKISGKTKIDVAQRIACQLWPSLTNAQVPVMGLKVKNKVDNLKKTYAKKAACIKVTGGGIGGNDGDAEKEDADDNNEDSAEFLECYITADGSDDLTPEHYKHIWDKIEKEFKVFPYLHALLATQLNVNPAAITTGIRPNGFKTVYYQRPEGDGIPDKLIDPVLLQVEENCTANAATANHDPSPAADDIPPAM
ncbi:hypothetical protein SCP_0903500 [Sparassis crispa]|uniref:Uncharacterized protein n=1 Tax=Sparassis crispa TaxID=139825 RepID=A0A401GW76_9APHY|nr:hypothetical protein SCP_0903500 [Sparassis crispa]GBE86471.1 hypothetical protein SCP_0903500 [Sparassis crispa]